MTTPSALHAATWAILRALPTVTGYNADVPTAPPADSQGRVFPYAVLWPSPGGAPDEATILDDSGDLDWFAQVTVAAGDPTWVLQSVTVVRAALVGVRLVPAAGPLVDVTPSGVTIGRDPAPGPTRWFVPLQLRCLTA